MAFLRVSVRRFWPLLLAVAVQAVLLSAPAVVLSQAPPDREQRFVGVNSPVGVAFNPSGLGYVTRPLCGNPRQVLRVTSTRSVSVLATLPPLGTGDPTCYEHKIVVSPGPKDNAAATEGGYPTLNSQTARFVSNEIYVTSPKTTPGEGGSQQVLTVLKIPLDLTALINQRIVRYLAPTTFASFSTSLCNKDASTGITFDEVGTFGFRLIVVCSNPPSEGGSFGGKVFAVANNGAATQIATIPTIYKGPFERPVVAPLGEPWNGNLLIPAENAQNVCEGTCPSGRVLAVTGEGTVTVASIPSAEAVAVKQDTACNFGLFNLPQGATYFAAKSGATPGGNRVDFIPRAPFAGMSPSAFVISENAEGGIGIWRLTAPFTAPIPFSASTTTHEDAAFVDCFVPTIVPVRITGRGTPLVDVAVSSIPGRFDAARIDVANAILTPFTGTTATPNGANHPVPGSCRTVRGGEGGDNQGGDNQGGNNQGGNNQGGDNEGGNNQGNDEGRNTNTVHCTFVNNIGSGHGVFKAPVVDPAGPGDGSEGGC